MNEKFQNLRLSVLAGTYKFVSFDTLTQYLNALRKVESELRTGEHYVVCRNSQEMTLISPERIELNGSRVEPGWISISTQGVMPFGTVKGLVATVTGSLKSEGLGVCVVSFYESDVFLVREKYLALVTKVLGEAGWEFV